jgi:hypothetical protein
MTGNKKLGALQVHKSAQNSSKGYVTMVFLLLHLQ